MVQTLLAPRRLTATHATLRVNNLPVGNYNFKVTYVDDGNFTSSTNGGELRVCANAPNHPDGIGSLVHHLSLTAPQSPCKCFSALQRVGRQHHKRGTRHPLPKWRQLGTAAVSGGIATFTVNVPPVGSNAYTASYAGDGSFLRQHRRSLLRLSAAGATTMGITTSAPHGIIGSGQPMTLTATIAPYAVTGGASTNGEPATFYENGSYSWDRDAVEWRCHLHFTQRTRKGIIRSQPVMGAIQTSSAPAHLSKPV
jgi:hypothetical protein